MDMPNISSIISEKVKDPGNKTNMATIQALALWGKL